MTTEYEGVELKRRVYNSIWPPTGSQFAVSANESTQAKQSSNGQSRY